MTSLALSNVRAVVTSAFGKKGKYIPKVTRNLISYYVDTAVDQDTDTWQVEFGDFDHEFMPMFHRDAEARVQLYGVGATEQAKGFISTGVADEISFDEQGIIRLTGRDMSALATDSTVPPAQYKHIRSYALVERQAREIGLPGPYNLTKKGIVRKVQYTDGSESYWEFWYRLARKDKLWIWAGPAGSLNMRPLNYNSGPRYYFGQPSVRDPNRIVIQYIPVEHAELRKTVQGRVAEVWVFGHKGDNGFRVITSDPTTRHWIKRPRKIMTDRDAHTTQAALKSAWEEIFEGKIGAIEISLTITDPGFFIWPDSIAHIRIPEIGVAGDYYVVGTRRQAGSDGFVQEVRLRERSFATSRRVPSDPKAATAGPTETTTITSLAEQLAAEGGIQYSDHFIKAAKKHHGPWDFTLFLATLIAIGDQETAFRNIRAIGGPGEDRVEWYEWQPEYTTTYPIKDAHGRTQEQWKEIFANEPGSGYTSQVFAVGVMQLYSQSFKDYADNLFRQNYHNQFDGGRWHAEHNIMTAAYALRQKLQQMVGDTGKDEDMWAGVSAYGHHYEGEGPQTVPTRYAVSVKNKVFKDPGYLKSVDDALTAAREAQAVARDGGVTDGMIFDGTDSTGLPNREQALAYFRSNRGFEASSELEKRRGIVAAAMYGYWQRDQIAYTQSGQRMKDFGPPPNVPSATDCSAFATWCYKVAGAPDPNGRNYDGYGFTGTQVNRGQQLGSVSQLSPGDLVFYGGTSAVPGHVAIYVGNGKVVSHGSDPGPLLLSVNYRSDRQQMRTYM